MSRLMTKRPPDPQKVRDSGPDAMPDPPTAVFAVGTAAQISPAGVWMRR